MSWSPEARVEALMRLPWTVQIEHSDEGYVIARCGELPGTIATGSEDEIEAEFWDAVRATLQALVHFDDTIPRPAGVRQLPWEIPARSRAIVATVPSGAAATTTTESSGSVSRQYAGV